MKSIFFLIIILFSTSCNSNQHNLHETKKVVSSKIVGGENEVPAKKEIFRKDTLITQSKTFSINDMECYWNFESIIDQQQSGFGNFTMSLVDQKSNMIILTDSDYTNQNEVDTIDSRLDRFKDINFDGYKDFSTQSREKSGTGNDFYNVYLYDKKLKSFNYSEEFSNTNLEIDSINKTITSSGNSGVGLHDYTIKHLDNKSNVKFIENTREEVIQLNDRQYLVRTVKRIQNNKIIKTKVDTTLFDGY